ncbi:glutamate--cysteine ligase [Actinopolymorpha sp. B11F2]|uniref:carboxylate-amine ligase n=1 Tax=Actinopolymorpha sp. B11F2 TaxID=3160862 RepID=UPI0032E3AFE3
MVVETVGVEEEYLLVDPVSRRPSPVAQRVLDRARATGVLPAHAELHPELVATQIEAATSPCATTEGIRKELETLRALLCRVALEEDARLVSVGHPVLFDKAPPVMAGDRFARIAELYAESVRTYQACGCHVHVGTLDRESALQVVNRLRPWLPTLLALSANSAFDRGRDTSYDSWRIILQSQFPGAGIPPHFRSVAHYEDELQRLIDAGMLVDADMTFWLARPSQRFPTVEIRVADACASVADTVLQAALTRALVRRALVDVEAGREVPEFSDQSAAAAMWSAARHGLRGPAIDPIQGGRIPAMELLRRLLRHVRTQLDECGDLPLVQDLVERTRRTGTGAARQREVAPSGPMAIVDMLIDLTAREEDVPHRFARHGDG